MVMVMVRVRDIASLEFLSTALRASCDFEWADGGVPS